MSHVHQRLERAKVARIEAQTAYVRTWRRYPTAKGFAKVDLALAKLHAAEAEEAAAQAALAVTKLDKHSKARLMREAAARYLEGAR